MAEGAGATAVEAFKVGDWIFGGLLRAEGT